MSQFAILRFLRFSVLFDIEKKKWKITQKKTICWIGPEFGGSIGILFYIAYCVGASFYATGFAEELVATWIGDASNHHWASVGIASAMLFGCLLVALAGDHI